MSFVEWLLLPLLARQSLTSAQLRDQWQRYIRGWWNYFQLADRRWGVTDLSGWIRRHMRKCFWLRWSTPRGRIDALKRLGLKGRSLGMGYTGLGAWRVARHWAMHQALVNKTSNVMAISYLGSTRRRLLQSDDLCRVQPPDAENRMFGGVEGLRGKIPVSPSDRLWCREGGDGE